MLYILMGKSSSGKDTIFKELINDKELDINTIVTYTTRPVREGEADGVEYNFVSREDMERMESSGKVIERRTYNTIYGEWDYFTVDDGLYDICRKDYLIIGTLESFEKIRDYYGHDKVVPLYIEVEDGERLSRALARERGQAEPKYAEMCRRFLADEEDFRMDRLEKLGIKDIYNNNDIGDCICKLKQEIRSNRN